MTYPLTEPTTIPVPGDLFNALLQDAPYHLSVMGDTSLLHHDRLRVAIVGARACTNYGEHITGELVNNLPGDAVIVSGGAYGIDGAAHRAALMSGKGTILVSAGGLDRPYPAGHAQLFYDVAGKGGLLLSEHSPVATPTRDAFLRRNRLIVGLADIVVVVEAGIRSGSMNAANWARQLRVSLGAVPGPVTSPASSGTNQLIADGAHLITSSADILNNI